MPGTDREGLNRDDVGNYVVRYQDCPECGERFIFREAHLATSETHAQWLKGMIQEVAVAVPEQPKPPVKYSYENKPSKLVFGVSAACPRCHGVLKLRKIPGSGSLPCACPKETSLRPGPCAIHRLDTVTMDPHKPTAICPRCDGMGIVPNQSV